MMFTINIPKRGQKPTNGEVLKAVFGCGEVFYEEAEDVNMICAYGMDATPTCEGTFFTESWWNKPFTREWAKDKEGVSES